MTKRMREVRALWQTEIWVAKNSVLKLKTFARASKEPVVEAWLEAKRRQR